MHQDQQQVLEKGGGHGFNRVVIMCVYARARVCFVDLTEQCFIGNWV